MATTSNVLTPEKNTFQQQSKQPMVKRSASTQPSNPSTTKTAKRKRNPCCQERSMSTRSRDVFKEVKRPAVIVIDTEDDERSTPIIGNFTLYRNSEKDVNSVTVLNNSAQRSKKLLEFHARFHCEKVIQAHMYSSTVYIDGVEIATGLGCSAKIAKRCCADKAVKRLKETYPIVDTYALKAERKKTVKKTKKIVKKSKRIRKKLRASQEKLPVVQNEEYTKLTITQDNGGRCIITQKSNETLMATTAAQKRHNPDVAVHSKEKAKKTRLFVKENTSVEKVACPSGQHSQLGPSTTNLYPEIPKENLGHQLLKRMGWMGGGLGRQGNEGRVEPVMHAMVRRRQGLGVDLRKQPGRKINNQVRNKEPCKPFSAITIGNQANKSVNSNIIQPSSATTTVKPVCNINLSAAATIQPFPATTSKSVSIIQPSSATATVKPLCNTATTSKSVSIVQPSFPISRLSASNINPPFAVTTNKSVSNIIQPSPATATMKPVCNINLSATATIQPFPATTSKSVSIVQPSFPTSSNINQPSAATTNKSVSNIIQPSSATATMKPVCNTATTSKSVFIIQPSLATPRLSASDIIQPSACKTSQSVIDVDTSMLFQPTSTNSARNGATSHPPLMSSQLVSKPKTTVSPVPSKPVASTVKASLPIPSNSVRDVDMLFQPTSTQSVRNSIMSEAVKFVIDKQRSCVTSNPIDVIDVDMVTAQTKEVKNINFETSVKSSLLKTVLNFMKSSKKELRLSELLTRESRINLFRMCDARGLQFQSFIKAKKRTIVISKPED